MIAAVILAAAVLYFTLGSIELAIAALLPLAFGLLWFLGGMGWIGIPLDSTFPPLVIFMVAIGVNSSLLFINNKLNQWRGQFERPIFASRSFVLLAVTVLFTSGALLLPDRPVLLPTGTITTFGAGCALLAAFILTPLCMDLLLFHAPPRGAPRWWHLLGTVWVSVHLGSSEVFLYYVLRPLLKIFWPPSADDRLRRATSRMARGVVKGLPFGKLEFQNIGPGTFDRPAIVISNHQSAVDVMLMVSMPGDVRQTAKKRVFDTPILGIGCKVLGHVLVEPKDPQTTLRRCREKLAEGASVHFFPEGTRSYDGGLQRFHRGAFELAVELQRDILPITLCDTWTAMPRDAYWFEPYHVTVRALPRITPQNFDYRLGSLALMRHCETVVRQGVQQQLEQVNTPRVLRRKVERLYRYQGKFVEQFVHWKLVLDPMFKLLDEVVPRTGFILDLGCGYGLATHWLAYAGDERTLLGVDFDERKIRVARRTAQQHRRIRFELADVLSWECPPCDAILLLDVLHYWVPEKQQLILQKARRALRPGGSLILREAARQPNAEHLRVEMWEKLATSLGHNRTKEGLHFRTLAELTGGLQQAGFVSWETMAATGRDSNLLVVCRA